MDNEKKCDFVRGNFWQSIDYNERAYLKYLTWICKLAISRFRWIGLPETCNERVLETTLLMNGVAAISMPDDLDVWFSLPCAIQSPLSIYGDPIKWRCIGVNGDSFNSGIERGAVVYNSKARMGIWNMITLNARKLAHYDRTEDINLSAQKTPWLLTTSDSHRRDLNNVMNQVLAGEVAIAGTGAMLDELNIGAINLDVPFKGAELGAAKRVLWSEILTALGIPSMPYEKGERMIEAEAQGNESHTNIMMLDALGARREACEHLNREFGLDVQVVFNRDYESYNFNYLRDLERQGELQDEVAGGVDMSEEPTPNIGGIIDTIDYDELMHDVGEPKFRSVNTITLGELIEITSIVKDYSGGRMKRNVAETMLRSLGIDNNEIFGLLGDVKND